MRYNEATDEVNDPLRGGGIDLANGSDAFQAFMLFKQRHNHSGGISQWCRNDARSSDTDFHTIQMYTYMHTQDMYVEAAL